MPIHALHDMHVYIDIPTPIFRARINQPGAITYPATTLTFDTVTLGAFGDIQPDMTLILGTALGLDDLGRVRVQKPATSTTIPIGRVSQGTEDGTLNIADNMFAEVWDDYRVVAKIPFSNTDTGIDYKDADEPVGDFNIELAPVSNCGVGTADYINPSTSLMTVQFPSGGVDISYAMADGATIVSREWDVKDGTITVGTSASAVITATFPAGKRWVVQTVTDSNGKQHSSRCFVLSVNPAADVTIPFAIESWEKTQQGQTFSFRLLDNRLRTTYPDGCLVLFWWDAPLSPADRSHMQFIGWHQSDSFSIRATPTGLIRDTVLNCVDVAGRLAALPGFPQALQREDEDDVDEMWSLMPTLDMRKCLHYLIFWHSTAAGLADLFLSADLADYPAMRLDSTGASLYEQINSRAQSIVPDHWFVCNAKGQLSVLADWMLLDFADRPTIVASLSEDYWSSMEVTYQRPPKLYVLNSSAVVCSTDWLMLGGEKTLPLAFCKAPGTAFGQGVSEATTGEKLTISQDALNACEGHRRARLDARYGLFSITEPSGTIAGDADSLEPAAMLPIEVAISAATAAQRGLDFTVTRGMVKRISMRANTTAQGTWFAPTIQFEKEVIGLPAVTHVPEIPDTPDYETPEPPPGTVPPDNGLIGGQQMVAGIGIDGYIYRTSDFQTVSGSGGPTWTRVDTTIADTIYSFVVDPFSPGYIDGAGAINGWIANDTAIYRVSDLFGSATATSVFAFPTATSGASFHWRSIQASFGAYFAEGSNPWLLCISYYGDTAGHTGTWAARSTDGGATWAAEVLVSAHYDEAPATRFNPIGVYTSPKTPGLAYTAAYIETAMTPLADGHVSTDWGETWTRVSEDAPDDAIEQLPRWGIGPNAGPVVLTDPTVSQSITVFAGPGQNITTHMMVIPPADAVRILIAGNWFCMTTDSGGIATPTFDFDFNDPASISKTIDTIAPVHPGPDGTTSGGYLLEWTLISGTDWPVNRDSVISSPPTTMGPACNISAQAIGGSVGRTIYIGISARVIEIELDDSTIYIPPLLGNGFIQPGHGQAGSIHLPWPDNAAEDLAYYGYLDLLDTINIALRKAVVTTQTDISPTDTGVDFGVNRGHFGVRTYDSDRSHTLMAGVGNDTSDDPADNTHGIFYSDDTGSTWSVVVTPMANTEAPAGRPALEAAFAGDDPTVHFYWGAKNYISYTSNAGVAVDSRAGNLSSFGSVYLIGIAGGPNE